MGGDAAAQLLLWSHGAKAQIWVLTLLVQPAGEDALFPGAEGLQGKRQQQQSSCRSHIPLESCIITAVSACRGQAVPDLQLN